ncbi:hypothetical protein M5585_16835 [Serratia ureilytica]
MAPLAVVTGAISTQTFHLDILSALSAIIAGHLFGGIFLALTSAQGHRSEYRKWCRAGRSLAATARCW